MIGTSTRMLRWATHGGFESLDASVQPLRAACGFGLLWRAVALKLVMNQSEWYFDPHASLGLRMAALRVWMPSL